MTHALKTWIEYYADIESGKKNFEVRKNDRPFEVGETLLLQEWDNAAQCYTGCELKRRITYILDGGQFGIDKDYCVMSLEEVDY